jgi:hypothetical protein
MRPFSAVFWVTFVDVTRSPAYGIVLLAALLAQALSPALAMFGFDQQSALMKEFSVSTVLLTAVVLVGLGASTLTERDLRSRTVEALLSKPLSRYTYVWAKYFGLVAALFAALYVLLLVLLLTARQGPPSSVADPWDGPVVVGGLAGAVLAAAATLVLGLRSSRPLGQVALLAGAAAMSVGCIPALVFDASWELQPLGAGFDPELVKAVALVFLGGALLGSVAMFLSILVGRGAFLGTLLAFGIGLTAGGWESPWTSWIPAVRVFWVGEMFYQRGSTTSLAYLANAWAYAASYSVVSLLVGGWILARREVGTPRE